jgi:pimeloyl-ACP methyl ester carboxylesterase
MGLPTLQQSFSFAAWTVKWDFLEPSPPPPNQTSASPTKTVVFVHGTPWSSVVFRPLADAIRAVLPYRILLYDLPGYGESQTQYYSSYEPQPKGDKNGFVGDTSIKAQAEVLAALLAHVSLDGKVQGSAKPVMIAHDVAGTIALRAHLLHGCEFERLVLMDTNCVLPWGDGFYKLARELPETFLRMPHGVFEGVVRSVVRSAIFESAKVGREWEDLLTAPWIKSTSSLDSSQDSSSFPASAEERQSNFISQIAQANDEDVREMLDQDLYSNVRCKVKILWGEQDQWIPGEKMQKLKGLLGNQCEEFVTVPRAGHLLMIDQPERVTGEVLGWLWKKM